LLPFFVSLILWTGSVLAQETLFLYEVSWMGIRAGKIKLLIRQEGNVIYLQAKSKTTGMVRLFFPFESRWETWCTRDGYPIRSRIYRRKGDQELVKYFVFDQKRGYVWKIKEKKGKRNIKKYHLLHYPAYDELAGFVKSMHLKWREPGEKKRLWIYAHKKANLTEITFLEEEKADSPWGKVLARKLLVEFGFESELVKRAKRSYLWLYQDKVIKAEGEMIIGHLTVKLKEVRE
jgi:hypothetical protein